MKLVNVKKFVNYCTRSGFPDEWEIIINDSEATITVGNLSGQWLVGEEYLLPLPHVAEPDPTSNETEESINELKHP